MVRKEGETENDDKSCKWKLLISFYLLIYCDRPKFDRFSWFMLALHVCYDVCASFFSAARSPHEDLVVLVGTSPPVSSSFLVPPSLHQFLSIWLYEGRLTAAFLFRAVSSTSVVPPLPTPCLLPLSLPLFSHFCASL